jgi:hypothetical protein
VYPLEGKGIAALTFDKDYQRKRREAMNQRPANVQMGLAQSGKGLVMVSKTSLYNLYFAKNEYLCCNCSTQVAVFKCFKLDEPVSFIT